MILEGDMKDDKLNGQGKKIIKTENGDFISEGNFINDELNGPGKKTYPSGNIQEGVFKDDNLI